MHPAERGLPKATVMLPPTIMQANLSEARGLTEPCPPGLQWMEASPKLGQTCLWEE